MKAYITFEMVAEIEGDTYAEIADKYDLISEEMSYTPDGTHVRYEGITDVAVEDKSKHPAFETMTVNQFYERATKS